MATETTTQAPTQRRSFFQWLASIGALVSAPCVIGILLIPFGLGAVMTSALFTWFDTYRYIFMAVAVALVVLAHVAARRGGMGASKFLWVITVLTVAFIAAELIVDPPWDRHANVPKT
jgi:hypothetical protein